ncbi:MAG: aldose 1-epimerase family protein [Pirellulaceae bacterium]
MRIQEFELNEVAEPPRLADRLEHATEFSCSAGTFQLQRFRLTDGPRAGVELLVVDSGRVRAAICPTRGMSLWKARFDNLDFGWKSPVQGPIHPSFVASAEPSGIGWLDGFDELLARCGLRSFGAPDFDAAGRVQFAVHGRVGNLPAQNVQVHFEPQHSQLHVLGEVNETRFLQYNLRLTSTYTFRFDEPTIEVRDRVTNAGGTPTSMQILYHVNIGQPILEGGAKLHLAAAQIAARDHRAAEDLQQWDTYLPPTTGYAEQVYFSESVAGRDGWSTALLTDSQAERGFALHYQPTTLPYFSQWKNTVAEADGYVTGLEPATGFPNPRSFEEARGRTVALAAGESRDFHLRLEGIAHEDRVAQIAAELAGIRGSKPAPAAPTHPDWCPK